MSYYYFEKEDKKNFELPGAKPHYNPDHSAKVKHIFLDLTLDIPNKSFKGICHLILSPVRNEIKQLFLDAVDLEIESVLIDHVNQPFDYDGQILTINLLQPKTDNLFQLAIAYSKIEPQRGLYFITPDQNYPNKSIQVWTQGEDEDSRYWFPCFDYPGQLATSEIQIKVEKPYLAISNGELIDQKEEDNFIIYHWLQKQIHPTYLMTLAVGDFAVIEDKWQNIPVNYYVDKSREADAVRSMGKTPAMIEFFSKKFGYPYPFPKYAQVCVDDFIFGGMENTSTTLLTDRCLLDERATLDNKMTESLVAHELAHQWFGDLLVIKHWSHAWLKEGMATYSEVLWTEYQYGKEEADYYRFKEANAYIQEDSSRYRRPIVTNIYREAIELYDRHLYEKGACIYHLIRTILGDELFDQTIHNFVNKNAHKTIETIDLLRAIEETTGYNLSPIFDQYVFRGGHPDFKINYSWDNDNNLCALKVTQVQAKEEQGKIKDLFELKIPVNFAYINSENKEEINFKNFTLNINQKEQIFYFPVEKKPDFISFDVGNNYLKTVKLEYPLAELKAQLKYDNDPISRIYASVAIAKKGNLEAIKALEEALKNDPFWGVKVEVAKQLGKIKLNQVTPVLIEGLKDKNPNVRKSIIEALSQIKTIETYEVIKNIVVMGDPSYYVESSAIRNLGSIVNSNLEHKQTEVIEILTEILKTKSGWNEIIRSSAIAALSNLKNSEKAVDLIIENTKLGIPQPLRLAAIRGLGSVAKGQKPDKLEVIFDNFEIILQDTFFLTQMALISGLSQIEHNQAISLLNNIAQTTPDGRVKRRAEEAIQSIQEKLGGDKMLKELKKEIDKLKEENQDLKSRLTKLEAK